MPLTRTCRLAVVVALVLAAAPARGDAGPFDASYLEALTLLAGLDAGGQSSSLHVTVRPWQGETCAVDTRDARVGYVERGFGGAYVFALIPVPLLLLGGWGLASEGRRRR